MYKHNHTQHISVVSESLGTWESVQVAITIETKSVF